MVKVKFLQTHREFQRGEEGVVSDARFSALLEKGVVEKIVVERAVKGKSKKAVGKAHKG